MLNNVTKLKTKTTRKWKKKINATVAWEIHILYKLNYIICVYINILYARIIVQVQIRVCRKIVFSSFGGFSIIQQTLTFINIYMYTYYYTRLCCSPPLLYEKKIHTHTDSIRCQVYDPATAAATSSQLLLPPPPATPPPTDPIETRVYRCRAYNIIK